MLIRTGLSVRLDVVEGAVGAGRLRLGLRLRALLPAHRGWSSDSADGQQSPLTSCAVGALPGLYYPPVLRPYGTIVREVTSYMPAAGALAHNGATSPATWRRLASHGP